jgi:hypothetical protein
LLQYLVYTNYASILEQSPGEAAGSALQFYLKVGDEAYRLSKVADGQLEEKQD